MAMKHLREKTGWQRFETDGNVRMGFVIQCGTCPNELVIYANNGVGLLPEAMLNKKIVQARWRAGRKANVCPDCLARARQESGAQRRELREAMEIGMKAKSVGAVQAKKPTVIEGPRVTPVVEPAMPVMAMAMPTAEVVTMAKTPLKEVAGEMSAIMRRSIFRRLDVAWDDEKNRYRPGETDEKIAKELDVAVSWVREVRVDSFGGLSNEQAKHEALAALHVLNLQAEGLNGQLVEVHNAYGLIGEVLGNLEQQRVTMTAQIEAVRQKIDAMG